MYLYYYKIDKVLHSKFVRLTRAVTNRGFYFLPKNRVQNDVLLFCPTLGLTGGTVRIRVDLQPYTAAAAVVVYVLA